MKKKGEEKGEKSSKARRRGKGRRSIRSKSRTGGELRGGENKFLYVMSMRLSMKKNIKKKWSLFFGGLRGKTKGVTQFHYQ